MLPRKVFQLCRSACSITARNGRLRYFVASSSPDKNTAGLSPGDSMSSNDESTQSSSFLSMAEQKELLARAALKEVPVHGWTQDAIVAAALNHRNPSFPVSMSGMFTPTDLVNWMMNDFNQQLRDDPVKKEWTAFRKIQWRLEQVIPLAESGQWHQGMAKGLQTPLTTRSQLHEFVELVAPPSSSVLYQSAIGGIFLATELHLLAETASSPSSSSSSSDSNNNYNKEKYEQTWDFLQERLNELEEGRFVNLTSGTASVASSIPMVASTAVAASFLDGIASLVLPSSATSSGGSIMPDSLFGANPIDYKSNK